MKGHKGFDEYLKVLMNFKRFCRLQLGYGSIKDINVSDGFFKVMMHPVTVC